MDNKTPNFTIIFVVVGLIALAGIAGGVALTIFDKDASLFYGFFGTMLTTVVGLGALARSQGKINESVTQVKDNVNGRMSRLIELLGQSELTHTERETVAQIGVDSGVIETVSDTPLYDNAVNKAVDNGA